MAAEKSREHRPRIVRPGASGVPASQAKKTKKRRLGRWLLVPALLAVLLWFLPAVIVHSPILNWALGRATADLNGTLSIGSASAGWLSPIEVRSVEVRDARGAGVLTLASAHTERSLAALLWNFPALGRFTLERPNLSIVLRPDGSNLEDLIAKYLEPKEEEKESRPMKIGLAVEIVEGGLMVTEELTGQTWRAEPLNATFDMSDGTEGPLAAKLSAALADARQAGKLGIEVKDAQSAGKLGIEMKDAQSAGKFSVEI